MVKKRYNSKNDRFRDRRFQQQRMNYIWPVEKLIQYNKEYYIHNIFFVTLVIALALVTAFVSSRRNHSRADAWIIILLFVYRMILSMSYLHLSLNERLVDTKRYYMNAAMGDNWLSMYGQARYFIHFILYPLINWFKLTYSNCFIFFSFLGFWGLCFLYYTIKSVTGSNTRVHLVAAFLLFIPGLNYWTSMIGKDAGILFGTGILFYSLEKLKDRKILFFLSLTFIGHVRPYVAMISLPCIVFALMTASGNIRLSQKILFAIVLSAGAIPLYFAFLSHVRIDTLDLATASEIMEQSTRHWGGGSYVDLTNANIVVKFLTYLFRPLYFDAQNYMQVIASSENMFYLLIFISMCTPIFFTFYVKEKSLLLRFASSYFLLGTIIMASKTPNLGTAVRQKNMFMPAYILIFSMYLYYVLKISVQYHRR